MRLITLPITAMTRRGSKTSSPIPKKEAAGAGVAVAVGRSTGGVLAEVAGSVINTIVRVSPIVILVSIQGSSDKSIEKQTTDDGTPVGNLRKLPQEKIDEMDGEGYTAPLKKQTGKSKANLYWDPSTGRVYTVPNSGGQPQWVDNVDPALVINLLRR